MTSHKKKVTLDDRVMNKKGRGYTIGEISSILTHYKVEPLDGHTPGGRLLPLFQQLHDLSVKKNLKTSRQRKQILELAPARTRRVRRVKIRTAQNLQPSQAVPNTAQAASGSQVKEENPTLPLAPALAVTRPLLSVQIQGLTIEEELTCSICYENHPSSLFPVQGITVGCTHETKACNSCLQKYTDIQVGSQTWVTLSCPLCSEELSFEKIKEYSSAEVFEKYDRQASMNAMKEIANFRMCLGPGCTSGQVHSSGDEQPIMTCNECAFKTCYTHQMPWHANMTCHEYDERNTLHQEQDQASTALIQKIGKICPNCSVPGIKVSGCDHLKCPRCNHEYCAQCLACHQTILKKGNASHKATCRYHSSQLPSYYPFSR